MEHLDKRVLGLMGVGWSGGLRGGAFLQFGCFQKAGNPMTGGLHNLI